MTSRSGAAGLDSLSLAGQAGKAGPFRHNAHIHTPPNFSAFDTVDQVVSLASEQGLSLICASNYYDHRIYDRFAGLCLHAGVFPLFGLEVILFDADLARRGIRTNDPGNPGRVYLCGLGTPHIIDPPASARATLSTIRANDDRRMHAMIDAVNAAMADRGVGVALAHDEIVDSLVRRHEVERDSIVLQERHIVQALQAALFAAGDDDPAALIAQAAGGAVESQTDPVAVQNDLRSALLKAGKPAYVDEEFVDFATAKQLILHLGGIPCYPVLGDGAKPVNEFEATPERLIESLRERGIHTAQFIPRRNSLELVERYARALRKAGIVLTVGTEHNTLELIPLQPACEGGVALTEELMGWFTEGACIAVAHQVLVARGESGYVDSHGDLVGDPDELARIGASLVEQVRAAR